MSNSVVVRAYSVGMTLTLALISFMSFTRPVHSARPEAQRQLYAQVPAPLDSTGKPPVASPAKGPGSALAYIQIPRFGENWLWIVVEGTAEEDLAEGPGHYAQSALPGAIGNFAVAAHRAGHGDPFIDFDTLMVGDKITLRQSGVWWTYEITKAPRIIEPNDTHILRQSSSKRKITLTTCWPKYGNAKRMFVEGILVDWSSKK